MSDKLKVPARIIYQMNLQIAALERQITKKQERIAELRGVLDCMEPDRPQDGRINGGIARAKALSPNRRTEIAKAAAKARWEAP